MKCPSCKQSFKFKQVPVEKRYIQGMYSAFHCIHCDALLKPAKKYIIFMNSGIIISAIGMIIAAFLEYKLSIGLPLIISGLIISLYAHFSISHEELN